MLALWPRPAAVDALSMSTLGSIWILAAPRSTHGKVFYIEMDGSQMEEEESEPGSVFTSENGRWDFYHQENGKGDL